MRAFCLIVFFIFGCNTVFAQQKDIFDVARTGTVSEANEILKKNPNAKNAINPNGFSPLILACYRGNSEVAKLLIEKGSDVDAGSDMGTALMAAVVKGNVEIAKLLLDKKADPNLSDPHGVNALIYAVKFQNSDAVKLLLSYGADKTHLDKEGKSAFEYAVFSNNPEIIQLLK